MKVFLHARKLDESDWKNEHREFARIPIAGEYLTRRLDSVWYEVQLVVHTPLSGGCAAEVYAVEVDPEKIERYSFW